MDSDPNAEDIDRQLSALYERMHQLAGQCLSRSSTRVARELKSRAKAERRLIPYLNANFRIMNDVESTFDVDVGVETAIETIALLESEEQARQFQPDFPQHEYDKTVQWMSACAYDNLGAHVAKREGYNSEGVHAAVEEGIRVCRRTGKLRCITCFREYAADVFLAAGDLQMSLHHARSVVAAPDEAKERRWCGADAMVAPLLYGGQLDAARQAAVAALEEAPNYHNRIHAHLQSRNRLEEVLLLQGRHEELPSILEQSKWPLQAADRPPAGEDLYLDLLDARLEAVRACCAGDYERAFALLSEWDQILTRKHFLSEWFEVRLRLVAVSALAGRTGQVQALAGQLEARAKPACNWLTLQRLRRLVSGTAPPSPLALLERLAEGPFAARRENAAGAGGPAEALAAAATSVESSNDAASAEAAPAVQPAPLTSFVEQLVEKIGASRGSEEARREARHELLAVLPESVSAPADASWLLYLQERVLLADGHVAEIWAWAEHLAARFPTDASVQSLFAWLGHMLRNMLGEEGDRFATIEKLERLFRASLDIDAEGPRNNARAGWFYFDIGRRAEAERFLARSFQLDRTHADAVLPLAQIYDESDRPRDALAVLDLAIREGCEHPRVAWQAGITANMLGQYEAALAYFSRYEDLLPGELWSQYYRAWSLLMLGRAEEALAAIEVEEKRRGGKRGIHPHIVRAWAASGLGDVEAFRQHFAAAMSVRLALVNELTESGLTRLLAKLYEAAQCLPPEAAEHAALRGLLLSSGLAPDQLFKPQRVRAEVVDHLNLYVCRLRQPLDAAWAQSVGCLFGQEKWPAYLAAWGVLALDEESAGRMALAAQAECYHLPAELLECTADRGPYRDSPGVVWQSVHRATEPQAQ